MLRDGICKSGNSTKVQPLGDIDRLWPRNEHCAEARPWVRLATALEQVFYYSARNALAPWSNVSQA